MSEDNKSDLFESELQEVIQDPIEIKLGRKGSRINPINWNKLPSSKRDALIYTKVFKREFIRPCEGKLDEDGYCNWCCRIIAYDDPHIITIAEVPAYSRDIGRAWEITKLFDDVQLHYIKAGTKGYGGTNMAVINGVHRGIAPTMAEALCIAALEACGIEVIVK